MCIICSQHRPKYLYINNYIHYDWNWTWITPLFSLLCFTFAVSSSHFPLYIYLLFGCSTTCSNVRLGSRAKQSRVREGSGLCQTWRKRSGRRSTRACTFPADFLLLRPSIFPSFSLSLSLAKHVCIHGLLYNSEVGMQQHSRM